MPYLLVSACWIIFAASLIHFVSTDRKFHTIVRDDRYYLMALILLGVVAAGCGYIWPFYGIEYEDAFEYTYSGILLAYQLPPRTESLNSICVSGSLEHCRSFMTLAHPIGLAVLVSWLPFRMRWWNHSAQILSTLASILTGLLTFLASRRWRNSPLAAGISAGLLFLTPSFFALWHTGLAEPVGAFLIICAVIFSYRLVETWGEDAHRGCWIEALYALELVCVLLLGTLVKRENAALTLVLPLVLLFQRRDAHPRHRLDLRTMMKLLATSGVAALAQLFLLTTDMFALDAVRPSAAPLFSIANFAVLAPQYLFDFADSRYSVLPLFFLIGVVCAIREDWCRVLFLILSIYIMMICSFAQDRDFVAVGKIPHFHFERYTLQIAPIVVLFAGAGAERCIRLIYRSRVWFYRSFRAVVLLSVATVLLFSIRAGMILKRNYYGEEQVSELAPARRLFEVSTGRESVGDRPLLITLVCGPGVDVLDSLPAH